MSRAEPGGAAGLDLGSTRIKIGWLDEHGALLDVNSLPAPPLRGADGIREADAEAYAVAAGGLLEQLSRRLPPGAPLGLASQRSTFVLWERESGKPRTPLVSWQDTRAADWCVRNADAAIPVVRLTGLVLSAHYVGPKLAAMQESDPALARELRGGGLLFGTLDCYLVWRWTVGRVHATDPTMAARTALFDIDRNDWSDTLLERFGVPRSILPRIEPTTARREALTPGLVLAASVADQPSGALALLPGKDAVLVNLGTGGFVLRLAARGDRRPPGFLVGPACAPAGGPVSYAIEGTINGAGNAVDRFGEGPTELSFDDPSPEAFCLPDAAGLGSPHWRPDVGLELSGKARGLDAAARRLVVLEGLLFRIRELLEASGGDRPPRRLLLSGGLSREPFLPAGLAALLDRPIDLPELPEGGLTGAARLAAGLDPFADPPLRRVEPGPRGAYLRDKYPYWLDWMRGLLDR
jgi:glycerol kinase